MDCNTSLCITQATTYRPSFNCSYRAVKAFFCIKNKEYGIVSSYENEVVALLKMFIPCLWVRTVYDINLVKLKDAGYKGIITDLDNTLIGAKAPIAEPELTQWLAEAKLQGFQVVIVSNNDHLRVSRFAIPLQIPFVNSARKPSPRAFHQALKLTGLMPKQVVVVGDQMLTDILGGNLIGMFTILVNPIAIQDERWTTRINRRIERVVIACLRKKGLWHEEE